MGAHTYPYQRLKLLIVHWIPMRPHDPYHIFIGFLALLAAARLLRRPLSHPANLLPGFALSLLMEGLDLHDDFLSLGHGHWGAALHGLAATNLLPLILVAYSRWAAPAGGGAGAIGNRSVTGAAERGQDRDGGFGRHG